MKRFISSWDDDDIRDNHHLAVILEKYNLPAIFYLTNVAGSRMIKGLDKMGFEIGGHTCFHPEDMKALSRDQALDEIWGNKAYLEDVLGKKITSFAYPCGKYKDETIEVVRECGFIEARTTNVMNIKMPVDPYRTYTSVHIYPHRPEYNGVPWNKIAKQLFDDVFLNNKGDYFHIWGHGWEISKFRLWDEVEELFKYFSIILKRDYADLLFRKE